MTICQICHQEQDSRRRDGLGAGCPQCGNDVAPAVKVGPVDHQYEGKNVYRLVLVDGLDIDDARWSEITGEYPEERHSEPCRGLVWQTQGQWVAVLWRFGSYDGSTHDASTEGPTATASTRQGAIDAAIAAWTESRI